MRQVDASDLELVESALQDRESFGLLFDRYFENVFRFCYLRLGNWHLAEDATSQVFLNALSSIERFQPMAWEGSFRAWLFGIARNVVGKSYRHSSRHPVIPLESVFNIPDYSDSAESLLLDEERGRQLRTLFSRLSESQQTLIELRLAGLSAVEIGSLLGRSPESIRKSQSRALSRLRELIREKDGNEYEEHHV